MYYPDRNFMALSPELAARERAATLVMPIPYDNTSEIKGAARGPWAIIDASQELELYEPDLDDDPSERGIHTLPAIEPHQGDPAAMMARIEEVVRGLDLDDTMLLALGGEHSVTGPIVRAIHERVPDVSVLHIDAHADMRDSYQGTRHSHASVAARLREICPVVSVGIRSYSRDEADALRAHSSRVIPARAIVGAADDDWIGRVIAGLTGPVYVTIDLDVLDSAHFPAVAFPEPGGLSWWHLTRLLARVAAERRIVAGDVVELCPDLGPRANAVVAARVAYRLIGEATRGQTPLARGATR